MLSSGKKWRRNAGRKTEQKASVSARKFDYGKLRRTENLLQEAAAGQENVLGIEAISEELEAFCKREITSAENAVGHAKAIIGDTSIVLDYLYHPRPWTCRFLLKHGFHVTTVYLDGVSRKEKMYLTG